jgi:hypothetical protein
MQGHTTDLMEPILRELSDGTISAIRIMEMLKVFETVS